MNHIWHALKVFSHPSILLFLCKAISSDTRLVECHLHQVMGYKDSLGTTTWWWVRSRQVVEFRRTSCGASALSVQWCHWGPLEMGFRKFETTGSAMAAMILLGWTFRRKTVCSSIFFWKTPGSFKLSNFPGEVRGDFGQTMGKPFEPGRSPRRSWRELLGKSYALCVSPFRWMDARQVSGGSVLGRYHVLVWCIGFGKF